MNIIRRLLDERKIHKNFMKILKLEIEQTEVILKIIKEDNTENVIYTLNNIIPRFKENLETDYIIRSKKYMKILKYRIDKLIYYLYTFKPYLTKDRELMIQLEDIEKSIKEITF